MVTSSLRDFSCWNYILLRSIPAFLATASSPFFSMVFIALVDKRNFTKRFPASHQILLYCRFTYCRLIVLWFEWETLFALFAFFPVKGQILPVTNSNSSKHSCEDTNTVGLNESLWLAFNWNVEYSISSSFHW